MIQTKDIINKISNGDKIILDAEQGLAYLRPDKTISELYISKLKLRNKAKKHFWHQKTLRQKLSIIKNFLMMNAGLMAGLTLVR